MLVVMATMFSWLSSTSKTIIVVLLYIFFSVYIFSNRHYLERLGLEKQNVRAGISLAIPFVLLIMVCAFFAVILKPDFFLDTRYDLSVLEVILTVLVIIPVTTVLLEEIIFRGILLGELLRIYNSFKANLLASLAFGIWHIFTAQAVSLPVDVALPITVIGVIIATSLAGYFFGWLRVKSKSLVAPILVHLAINSSGVIAAFIAWR